MTKTYLALSFAAGIATFSSFAADQASYYSITELVIKDGDNLQTPPYGPYAAAISDDGSAIALSTRGYNLEHTWDMALPYTFDYGCYYSSGVCDYKRYGSDSYPFGWSQWRTAIRASGSKGFTAGDLSYLIDGSDTGRLLSELTPEAGFDDGSNSAETYVTDFSDDGALYVGSGTAPYIQDSESGLYERTFSRRGFIKAQDGTLNCALLPDAISDLEDDKGGFSTAYGINTQVVSSAINSGAPSIIAVGSASVGLPSNSWDNYNACQTGDDDEYYRCPGFNTQAWAWDLSQCVNGDEELSGIPLAKSWLRVDGSRPTYSAAAFAINANGIAAGMSTYALSDAMSSGRARASYFAADDEGKYQLTLIPGLENGFERFDSSVRHTWAVDINDENVIVGNLRFNDEKGRNRPVEFFVYDKKVNSVVWPLRNKPKSGSNSYIVAINESNLAIGWQDAAGEDHPVVSGTSRRQSGFIYSVDENKSWGLGDLTCSIENGGSQHPLYKIDYPKAISDDGVIIAHATSYPSPTDYVNNINGTSKLIKLVPNPELTMDQAPLCSVLFADLEAPKYQRNGGAIGAFYMLLLMALLLRGRRYWHKMGSYLC